MKSRFSEIKTTSEGVKYVHDNALGVDWRVEREPGLHALADALALQRDGWRLPTFDELQTLRRVDTDGRLLYPDWLPKAERVWYWTSSQVVGRFDRAWCVYFGSGRVNLNVHGNHNAVRLVRSVGRSALDF